MNKYILFMVTLIFFTACTTKIEQNIKESKQEDVSKLIEQLAQKEKELNDISKKLERCEINKKTQR